MNETNKTNEMQITADNNIEVIVDVDEVKGNSKPTGFWHKVKAIWTKTVFARRIEENAWKRDLMKEIKIESKDDIKEIMREQYLKKERDKLSGTAKKSGFMGAIEKVGKALAEEGKGMGSGRGSQSDKLTQMLGTTKNVNNNSNQNNMNNKLMGCLGINNCTPPQKNNKNKNKTKKQTKKQTKKHAKKQTQESNKINDFEDKIKRMLQ